jgi:hypothetical protein
MLSDKSSWLPTRSPGVYLPIRRCEHLNFLYCMLIQRLSSPCLFIVSRTRSISWHLELKLEISIARTYSSTRRSTYVGRPMRMHVMWVTRAPARAPELRGRSWIQLVDHHVRGQIVDAHTWFGCNALMASLMHACAGDAPGQTRMGIPAGLGFSKGEKSKTKIDSWLALPVIQPSDTSQRKWGCNSPMHARGHGANCSSVHSRHPSPAPSASARRTGGGAGGGTGISRKCGNPGDDSRAAAGGSWDTALNGGVW